MEITIQNVFVDPARFLYFTEGPRVLHHEATCLAATWRGSANQENRCGYQFVALFVRIDTSVIPYFVATKLHVDLILHTQSGKGY